MTLGGGGRGGFGFFLVYPPPAWTCLDRAEVMYSQFPVRGPRSGGTLQAPPFTHSIHILHTYLDNPAWRESRAQAEIAAAEGSLEIPQGAMVRGATYRRHTGSSWRLAFALALDWGLDHG